MAMVMAILGFYASTHTSLIDDDEHTDVIWIKTELPLRAHLCFDFISR